MRELNIDQIANIEAKGKGRTCMILGGLALGAAIGQIWGAAIGTTAAATVLGCFDVY